jgi:hypothetical protein
MSRFDVYDELKKGKMRGFRRETGGKKGIIPKVTEG